MTYCIRVEAVISRSGRAALARSCRLARTTWTSICPLPRINRRSIVRAEKFPPRSAQRFAHGNFGDVLLAGDAEDAGGQIVIGGGDDFRAQFLGEGQALIQPQLFLLGGSARGFDMEDDPGSVQTGGQTAGVADEFLGIRARASGSVSRFRKEKLFFASPAAAL